MGSIGREVLPKMERMQTAGAHEENILVLVRLRPLSDKEVVANEVADWECINDTTILYRNTLREGSTFPSAYSFDRVFRGDNSTRQVYEQGAKEVALSVVSGINSSIFAYGQTSSGKTYTMMGITEYTVADIFDHIHRHEERAFVLKFSAIEIYNEAIRDLLSTDTTPLRLLDDSEKGTVVEKVTEETLKDWSDLKELLSVCEGQRQIGETSLNEKSSRSHQILRLTIESSAREFSGKENSTTLAASVNFVDLAGSERASRALSTGARLKEGCHINRSLLTLGTVIRKLSKGRHGHINYRDSKLTRLLQPALGGNARTAIICTLSPARSHVEQTRNTLMFACCAKEVTTKAQVNVFMSDKTLVKHLQRELARLETQLRSPAPASSTCDYATLLRKKDLQIQKMEKEIRGLTKQRDLAESRIEDLLQMIGQEQNSRKMDTNNYHPNQQAENTRDDECSVSESSGMADSPYVDGGVRKFNITHYDEDSASVAEEPYPLLDNNEDYSLSARASPLLPFAKKIVRSNSCQSLEDTEIGTKDRDDYCKEVQCIKMSNGENEGVLALTVTGDGAAAGQDISTPTSGDRQLIRIENGFIYEVLEQRLHHVQRTIDSLVSPYPDESSSPPAFAADEAEQSESTPSNEQEKNFSGRPESARRRSPPLNYSACTDDFRSQSIQASAEEEIPSIHSFVAELKEMAKQEYEKQLGENQTETQLVEDKFENSVKDVGVGPMHKAVEPSHDWPMEFERQQRAILELWQTCYVSLIHRTYFFLLFKGESLDSVYMEVELRRLSFLKDRFSQRNKAMRDGRTPTLASSIKELHRERGKLSKLMHKRFSEEERKRLYQKWGIALNSKRRSMRLVNCLWTDMKDINHINESAAIVAKLIKFIEQGQVLKEMFELSFTPPSTRRRSLGWTYSRSSLL